jgi:hypothetical protein
VEQEDEERNPQVIRFPGADPEEVGQIAGIDAVEFDGGQLGERLPRCTTSRSPKRCRCSRWAVEDVTVRVQERLQCPPSRVQWFSWIADAAAASLRRAAELAQPGDRRAAGALAKLPPSGRQ